MTNTRVDALVRRPPRGAGTSVVLATFDGAAAGKLDAGLDGVAGLVERVLVSAAVTTALNTDPSAAPLTVPIAPKNDPSTALVAAAPAPATTLLTVRSRFFGSVRRGDRGGRRRSLPALNACVGRCRTGRWPDQAGGPGGYAGADPAGP